PGWLGSKRASCPAIATTAPECLAPRSGSSSATGPRRVYKRESERPDKVGLMDDALRTRASLLARLGDREDRAAWKQFVELYGRRGRSLQRKGAQPVGSGGSDALRLLADCSTAVTSATSCRTSIWFGVMPLCQARAARPTCC